MSELCAHLNKHLLDEMEDIIKYDALANMAAEHGEHEMAFYLRRVIDDEWTHAEWLYDHLKERGALAPDARRDEIWPRVKAIVHGEQY